MEQAIRIDPAPGGTTGTPVFPLPPLPPIDAEATAEPSPPPRWEPVELQPPSHRAAPGSPVFVAETAAPAARASLSWELVDPAAGLAADQPQTDQTLIAGEPIWEPILPGDEFTSADVARELEAQQTRDAIIESAVSQVDSQTINVMSMSRAITVNRTLYPDVSLSIPNGFKRDPQRFLTLSLDGTNQVRRAEFLGCRGSSSCPDVEFNAELAILQTKPASLELLYTVANVVPDNNNSEGWTYQQLGFRLAANLSPTFGIAFGGESQATIDIYAPVDAAGAQLKGRTLYAVASAAIPFSYKENPPVLTISLGVGNGYYGFDGSGSSDSQWGPFGSISYAFNPRIGIVAEYSGYAFSAGISVKPLDKVPLTATLMITDFLGDFPSGIQSSCFNNSCSPRALGRVSYSF